MKTKKQLRNEFYCDSTNLVSLNKLCDTCKQSKKCYKNMNKICLLKKLAIEMTINKYYKSQND